MNTEFEAHRSDFPDFPEGPFGLVAGRLQSEPDLALSAPKCLVLLRVWAVSRRNWISRHRQMIYRVFSWLNGSRPRAGV